MLDPLTTFQIFQIPTSFSVYLVLSTSISLGNLLRYVTAFPHVAKTTLRALTFRRPATSAFCLSIALLRLLAVSQVSRLLQALSELGELQLRPPAISASIAVIIYFKHSLPPVVDYAFKTITASPMAYNEPPRRVSMGWFLGLSNKGPFKDTKPPSPPKPAKPNDYVKMMTTPGAVLEWAASDGRRNALTKKSKTGLAGALAAVPSKEADIKAWSKKAASEGGIGDLFGAFGGDVDNNATKQPDNTKNQENDKNDKDDKNDKSNTHGFTEADDTKLMEMKNSDQNFSWAQIGTELKMDEKAVKARFGQIKPKDWRPPGQGKKGGGGGGGGGKKDKGKGGQSEKKKEEKSGDAGPSWVNDNNNWGGADSGGNNKDDTAAVADGWNSAGWGDTAVGDKNEGGGDTTWGGADWGGNSGDDKKQGGDAANTAGGDGGWGAIGGTADNSGGAGEATWGNEEDRVSKKSGKSKAGTNKGDPWNNGGGDADWGQTNAPAGDNSGAWNADSGGGKPGGWGKPENNGGATGGPTSGWGNNQKDNKGSNDNVATGWVDNNAWNIQKPASKPASRSGSAKHSTKHSSKDKDNQFHSSSNKSIHRSHSKNSHAAPIDVRLYPDDTFSTSDLKQIARILHQDRSLLWERLAHRFGDKTNRRLPPEVFEKKFRKDAERERKSKG